MKNDVSVGLCDKCGRPVFHHEDVIALGVELEKVRKYGPDYSESQVDPWINTACLSEKPRHLFPVMDGEQVICEGSPSRAQYLEGQPRDTRGFSYRIENEALYRAAFARLQQQD